MYLANSNLALKLRLLHRNVKFCRFYFQNASPYKFSTAGSGVNVKACVDCFYTFNQVKEST